MTRKDLIKIITSIVILFSVLIGSLYFDLRIISAVLVLFFSFALVYEYRHNLVLLLVFFFIAYVNYCIAIGVYLFPTIRPNSLYRNINGFEIYQQGINTILLFLVTIFVLTLVFHIDCFNNQLSNLSILYESYKSNTIIEVICIVAYIAIFISQFHFNEGRRASTSPLSEYRFLFMIFGGIYSNKSKLRKIIWIVIISVTSILTFLGGNRINAFPGLILIVLLWFPKIKIRKVIWLFPIVLIVLQIIGVMRYNFSLSFSGLIEGTVRSVKTGFVTDSFTFAYYPSLTAIQLSTTQSFDEKVMLFLKHIIYIFAGGKYGQYVMPNYTSNYYFHYDGFIGPLYFNYWIGTLSGLIVGIITAFFSRIALIIKKGTKRLTNYRLACVLSFAALCPRWYCYNFFQLPRTIFIMTVLFFVFAIIDSITTKAVSRH